MPEALTISAISTQKGAGDRRRTPTASYSIIYWRSAILSGAVNFFSGCLSIFYSKNLFLSGSYRLFERIGFSACAFLWLAILPAFIFARYKRDYGFVFSQNINAGDRLRCLTFLFLSLTGNYYFEHLPKKKASDPPDFIFLFRAGKNILVISQACSFYFVACQISANIFANFDYQLAETDVFYFCPLSLFCFPYAVVDVWFLIVCR